MALLAWFTPVLSKSFLPTPPAPCFAGFENKGADTIRFGFKLGSQYKLNEQWTLGASYTEKTELPLTGGTAKFNFGSSGIAKYDNLSIKGFALPREIAIGAAFKPNADLLLSAKIDWINWADAINDVTTKWSDTSSTFAPAVMVNVTQQDWHNQVVYALGAAYWVLWPIMTANRIEMVLRILAT